MADPDASGEQRFVSLGSDPYDFSKAKRGPAVPVPTGKTRITIRLD